MGRKVFVSYKYKDNRVAPLNGYHKHTIRDYVDYLQDHKYSGDDYNKAENDNENLSDFKKDTIKSKLRDKIWDSSITLVLISPGMRVEWQKEEDQWMPWEVAYSLRTETRHHTRSLPNGMIAVVLPDLFESYDYFDSQETLIDDQGNVHEIESIKTGNTFKIIRENMFNQKDPVTDTIQGQTIYYGESSYIITVRWADFIDDVDTYFDCAMNLKENRIDEYELQKQP